MTREASELVKRSAPYSGAPCTGRILQSGW